MPLCALAEMLENEQKKVTCPLSQMVYVQPVLVEAGGKLFTYERERIQAHIKHSLQTKSEVLCPITRLVLDSKQHDPAFDFPPDRSMMAWLQSFRDQCGVPEDWTNMAQDNSTPDSTLVALALSWNVFGKRSASVMRYDLIELQISQETLEKQYEKKTKELGDMEDDLAIKQLALRAFNDGMEDEGDEAQHRVGQKLDDLVDKQAARLKRKKTKTDKELPKLAADIKKKKACQAALQQTIQKAEDAVASSSKRQRLA